MASKIILIIAVAAGAMVSAESPSGPKTLPDAKKLEISSLWIELLSTQTQLLVVRSQKQIDGRQMLALEESFTDLQKKWQARVEQEQKEAKAEGCGLNFKQEWINCPAKPDSKEKK